MKIKLSLSFVSYFYLTNVIKYYVSTLLVLITEMKMIGVASLAVLAIISSYPSSSYAAAVGGYPEELVYDPQVYFVPEVSVHTSSIQI